MSKSDLEEAKRFSRRDMLRRAAVTGGALIWIAPAVQTLAPTAAAHSVAPGTYTCCECRTGQRNRELCSGTVGLECTTISGTTEANCKQYCFGKNKSYCFHAGPTSFSCDTATGACGSHDA